MAKVSEQNRSRMRWNVAAIFIVFLAALVYIFPGRTNTVVNKINETTGIGIPNISQESFKLGLDLQGGAHLIYTADTTGIADTDKAAAVDGVRDVIERRVNAIGVGEPNVQTTRVGDSYRLIVELPGVTDINDAIKRIGETPILEFKTENEEPARELTAEEIAGMEAYNAGVKTIAEEAAAKVAAGTSFEEIVSEYSEDEQSKANNGYIGYVPTRALAPEWKEWVESAEEGAVSPVIENDFTFGLFKKGATREAGQEAEASHILICFLGARNCDNAIYTKPEAEELAKKLFEEANADNFAELARQNSTEPNAALTGGELGYIAEGESDPDFEAALFNAEVGQIIGPVKTQFGFHVIYKTGQRAAKEHEISLALLAKQTETDIIPPSENWNDTELSGSQLDRAEVVTDPQTGAVQVSLNFDNEGKELFAQITRENVGKTVAIFLDGYPISIPVVQQEITNGQAVISGNFSIRDAQELAQRLNTGALPVPVELESQQTVGASLGAESLEMSLKAGMVGLLLVMLFMILYYRVPGVIAVVALGLYVALLLAIFKLIGVTLTLAGIAGVILSIGMAVDANVLIFERLKEELKDGKSLKLAVNEGFERAWTSIRDGNVSTILIALILLFSFQSSFVRGFALTLLIGIALSMFSAITITRTLMKFVIPWFEDRGHFFFLGRKKS